MLDHPACWCTLGAARLPSGGRSREQGEAKARRARLRTRAAADGTIRSADQAPAEAARFAPAAGFTLIEIMVVIVILGILAALIVPRVLERPDEARAIAAKSDIAAIMQGLRFYRIDNQRYPTTEQGLAALVARPTQPPLPPNWKPNGYLERLPKDPWGHPYQYLQPGLRGEIDVFSFGADGQAGGTGTDADIGSWDL